MKQHDKDSLMLALIVLLWTFLASISYPLIGLIGLFFLYRRISSRIEKTE